MAQEKALGQYFTPPHIVQLMIDLIGKGSKDRRILEPSAGKGVFINLLKKRGFSNLLGIEVDPVIANHSPFPLIIGNFFDCPISEKFDIVIGNPPYVRWKNLTKEQRNFLSSSSFWHKRMNGLTDILQPFIFKSVDHLNSGGELIFITPSFWMQTLHSYPLRRFLNENGSIEFVINFGEIRIFSNVNLNLVIFKYKKEKKNIPIKIIKIKKKAILTSKLTKFVSQLVQNQSIWSWNPKLEDQIEFFLSKQPSNNEMWRFIPRNTGIKLAKFEKSCKYSPKINLNGFNIEISNLFTKKDVEERGYSIRELQNIKFGGRIYYTFPKVSKLNNFLINDSKITNKTFNRYIRIGDVLEIGNGMVSGLDKAFRFEKEFHLSKSEKKIIISVLKAKNIRRFTYEALSEYFLIKPNYIPSEEVLKSKYPGLFNQLQFYKSALEKRYQYNRFIPYWEWVFIRNYQLMKNAEKLICVPCKDRFDTREHLRFALCEKGVFSTQDVTVLVKKKWVKESIEYITAFLNSTLVYEWVINKGLVRGGVVEFSERPLSAIPFRLINWRSTSEKNIHDKVSQLVQEAQKTHKEDLKLISEIDDLIVKLIGFQDE